MAAASLAALSCTKENISSPAQDGQPDGKITFSAGFEDIATKTNLAKDGAGEYTKMVWSAGDVIGIFDKNGKPQPFTTEAGGASAVFTGAAEAPSDRWYAFYPYREDAKISTSKGLETYVPEIQYAKKDGVSDNVTLLQARCDIDKTSFTFSHVCGLVRVNVPEGCIAVTIDFPDAQASEKNACALAGGFASAFNYDWTMYRTDMWYRSVTLVARDGGAMAGGNYYIAVLPVNYTGKVMLTMRRKDGKISIKQADGLQVGAGEVRPINVTPVWEDDLGVVIYNGEKNIGYWWDGSDIDGVPSVQLDEVEDEKVIGSKSIRWELTAEKKWTGYLRFHGDNGLPLDTYLNDYAIEYYVKANRTALDAQTGWEMFYHSFGSLENKAPIHRTGVYAGINCLNNTDWHRVSIPLKDVFPANYTFSGIQMHILPDSDSKAAAAKGSVYYVNDVRIIKKTATK